MKTGVKLLLVSIMSLSLVGLPVLADAKGGHGDSLKEKFFHKAHFILVHQKSLELTEGEVESIKALKMDVKKYLIRQGAEIDLVKTDIMSLLWAKAIDTETIHGLIDQKYELKKAKAKYLVDAYAKLKGMLTDEQYEELKELWRAKYK